MDEILRTNDIVLVSYVSHLLADAGIEVVVLDAHMSVIEGSLGILPRRLMVASDRRDEALVCLKEAGVELNEKQVL